MSQASIRTALWALAVLTGASASQAQTVKVGLAMPTRR